ncbi:MAG: xanthine dehydrogenase accessory protein XdhC [Paracoccaceae bacterium]|nr:xanthine dehydrogenase accessory protein XdhC [Paracoccaceae bacterium]
MSFDRDALALAVATHGQVARVVVAEVAGSAPREVGAAMLVWQGGQSGTIGGGALELQAAEAALHRQGATRHPLGPELGQCCGGAVTLWTDVYNAQKLNALADQDVIARGPGEMPLAVHRLMDRARARGQAPVPQLVQGWMVEPVLRPNRHLWIWGAGHVGRALVAVLAPVPQIAITWVDTSADRFPEHIPNTVTPLWAEDPTRLAQHAPPEAEHLILTYSHALDLGLCDALLKRGFAWAGLIGSDTKWARFRKRLRAMGHEPAQIDRICCPIGQKSLGKHPQAIAVGVAAQLLKTQTGTEISWPITSSASEV